MNCRFRAETPSLWRAGFTFRSDVGYTGVFRLEFALLRTNHQPWCHDMQIMDHDLRIMDHDLRIMEP